MLLYTSQKHFIRYVFPLRVSYAVSTVSLGYYSIMLSNINIWAYDTHMEYLI